MKKTISRNLAVVTAIAAFATCAVLFTACQEPEPIPTTVAVTGVSLDKSSLSLQEGASETLTAIILPTNASNKSANWESSDTGVATVYAGKVTAVKAGTATITVTTADGGKKASCSVTVTEREPIVMILETTLVDVPEEGGLIEIPIQTNTEFTVKVEQTASDWISYEEAESATSDKLAFSIAESIGDIRSCYVKIISPKKEFDDLTITFRQTSKARRILMDIYNSMGGPTWEGADNWGTDAPLKDWEGVIFINGRIERLLFNKFGLKGEIPESLGELT